MFASFLLEGIDSKTVESILADTEQTLQPTHFRNGTWIADYKRLRVIAIKSNEY